MECIGAGRRGCFFCQQFHYVFSWLGYKIVKKWKGEIWGYISLITFWMSFEFIHLQDWGLSWPWLTLGNVFATHTSWIQWYELTGVAGGSFWILCSNVLVFAVLKEFKENGRTKKYFIRLSLWLPILIVPVLLSRLFYFKGYWQNENAKNIVIVQPNIDPYAKVSEQAGSLEWQLQRLINTSEKRLTIIRYW